MTHVQDHIPRCFQGDSHPLEGQPPSSVHFLHSKLESSSVSFDFLVLGFGLTSEDAYFFLSPVQTRWPLAKTCPQASGENALREAWPSRPRVEARRGNLLWGSVKGHQQEATNVSGCVGWGGAGWTLILLCNWFWVFHARFVFLLLVFSVSVFVFCFCRVFSWNPWQLAIRSPLFPESVAKALDKRVALLAWLDIHRLPSCPPCAAGGGMPGTSSLLGCSSAVRSSALSSSAVHPVFAWHGAFQHSFGLDPVSAWPCCTARLNIALLRIAST